MLVLALPLALLFYAGIDFLSGHANVALVDQGAWRWYQTLLNQQRIDGIVAGHVPAELVALLPAGEMRQGTVQGLVRQHELGLIEIQGVDVTAVEIKVPGVGGRGPAPLGVGLHHRQP